MATRSITFGFLKNIFPGRSNAPGDSAAMPVAAGSDNSSAWRIVSAAKGGFKVEMPGTVSEEVFNAEASSSEAVTYQLRLWRDGFFYSAACLDYGRDDDSGDRAATQAMAREKASLLSKEFQLLQEKVVHSGRGTGLEYEIVYTSGSHCVRRSLRLGTKIYRLDVTFAPHLFTAAEEYCQRFFNSLILGDVVTTAAPTMIRAETRSISPV